MALEPRTLQTAGLEPELAMARCKAHIRDARQYTLGPMPVMAFLNTFMQTASLDRKDMLSSKGAFNAVPKHADNTADIYEPLVCPVLDQSSFKNA